MPRFLKWILFIELALFFLAIILEVATKDAADFSGIVVIYPLLGMLLVAIPGIIGVVYHQFSKSKSKSVKSGPTDLTKTTKNILLTALLGLPVAYGFSFIYGPWSGIALGIIVCLFVVGVALLTLVLVRKLK